MLRSKGMKVLRRVWEMEEEKLWKRTKRGKGGILASNKSSNNLLSTTISFPLMHWRDIGFERGTSSVDTIKRSFIFPNPCIITKTKTH